MLTTTCEDEKDNAGEIFLCFFNSYQIHQAYNILYIA